MRRLTHLPAVVVQVVNEGFVAEATYDAYGFPKDTTWDGTVKERDVNTIGDAGKARAEWPSHPAKCQARKNHATEIVKQQAVQHNKQVDDVLNILNCAERATQQVRQAVIFEVKHSHLQPPFPQEVEIFTEGDWWEGQIESRDGNKSVTVSFKGGTEDMNIIIKAKEWSDRLRVPEGDSRVADVEADQDWMRTRAQICHFAGLVTKDLTAFIRVRQAGDACKLPKKGNARSNWRRGHPCHYGIQHANLTGDLAAAFPGTRACHQTNHHPSHIPAESGPNQRRDPSGKQISEQSTLDRAN